MNQLKTKLNASIMTNDILRLSAEETLRREQKLSKPKGERGRPRKNISK
jgi:hypothetical protein